MNSLATNQIEIRATAVRVSDDALIIDLSDGRAVSAPLAWYPRLLVDSWVVVGIEVEGRAWPVNISIDEYTWRD